jgi:hypothetical protein|tara:strand:- start:3477 stop:3962 length:486 start_codon:yes stop_codon:yes gene_type:complete
MALHDVLKDWVVSELSVPHASVNGHALCPFAKNAWFANKVKLREEKDNLWDAVYEEIQAFDDTYQVVICASYLHKQSYDDLEASCFALNGWLATTGHDIWLLAFKEKKLSMVFIQRLTDIDNASAKLESLGYYSNYEDQDYQRLVKHRKDRRISYDEKTNA